MSQEGGGESSSWQVRDDLFYDPAYDTKLFEILYILEVIYNKLQASICKGCWDKVSEVVIGTCRSWLDDDENTDYPLNPRTIIKSVCGSVEDGDVYLTIVTALNAEPVAVHSAGFQRFVVNPRWVEEAVNRFVSHVPVGGDGPEELATQREWAYKLWYLLQGTYDADELLFGKDVVQFGTDMSQFLVMLAQQYPDEEGCCPFLWPYPSVRFPCSQAAAEETEELMECVLRHMEDEVEGVLRSALKSFGVEYWLAGERNQLVILREVCSLPSVKEELARLREEALVSAHGNVEFDIVYWQTGMVDREEMRLPGVPIGSEEAIRGYEVSRMARIINMALDDLDFGNLFGPVEVSDDVDMSVDAARDDDTEMTDIGAGDENQHMCDAGEAPAELGRFWE